MIYFVLLTIISVLTYLGTDFSSKPKFCGNIFIAGLIAVFMVLLAGLRDGIWTDWEGYSYCFYNLDKIDSDMEIGYLTWNRIVYNISHSFNFYLLLSYTILVLLFSISMFCISRAYYLFSLLIFYTVYLLPSGGFRLFIAEMLVLCALVCLVKKRYFYYFGLVVLAGFFHRTAFICIFFPLIVRQNVNFKIFVFLFCGGLILKSFGLFDAISNALLSGIMPEEFSSVSYRLNYYNNDDEVSLFNVTLLRRVCQCLLFVAIFLYSKKNIENSDNKLNIYRKFINIYMWGILVKIILPGTFARITAYFVVTECAIIPLSIELLANSIYKRRLSMVFYVILMLSFVHKLLTFHPELFIPYKNIILS